MASSVCEIACTITVYGDEGGQFTVRRSCDDGVYAGRANTWPRLAALVESRIETLLEDGCDCSTEYYDS